ncbi:phytoene/squalene synthase family protein [Enterovirga rhinocerotis]|uniref:Phytoene synthase n=1 Tax=Enterovirga rhinocerotis TaxID=1339210 RepID=A0A4R7C0P6_9HYPH|nr:phytoene/squalene synthase family protein [Enterovirga rhinocerotis]TDR89946.1 phytoene synthase [Enterovirga rhinocerotis]
MDHDLDAATSHCLSLLREHDRDRYWSVLLAPASARGGLAALYAFSVEIARVREAVSAPMPGEIRLQWWRDAIAGEARGDVDAHPVALAIRRTIEAFSLPRQAFLDMIDARVFDLYDDPMPSLPDLEGYLGETSSALMRLAGLVLAGGTDPGFADAAGHAGLAYGLTGLLRALPWHARDGRLVLPKDVLDRYGVTRDDIVRGRGGPGVVQSLAVLRAVARDQDRQARALLKPLPKPLRAAFLPLALVPADLAELDAAADPLAVTPERPAWKAIWRLWRARQSGF